MAKLIGKALGVSFANAKGMENEICAKRIFK
jgi:hypothetical protein